MIWAEIRSGAIPNTGHCKEGHMLLFGASAKYGGFSQRAIPWQTLISIRVQCISIITASILLHKLRYHQFQFATLKAAVDGIFLPTTCLRFLVKYKFLPENTKTTSVWPHLYVQILENRVVPLSQNIKVSWWEPKVTKYLIEENVEQYKQNLFSTPAL